MDGSVQFIIKILSVFAEALQLLLSEDLLDILFYAAP